METREKSGFWSTFDTCPTRPYDELLFFTVPHVANFFFIIWRRLFDSPPTNCRHYAIVLVLA